MKFLTAPLLTLLICSALGACAATDIPAATALVDGGLTAAPAGWTSYCDRHVEDAGCRR